MYKYFTVRVVQKIGLTHEMYAAHAGGSNILILQKGLFFTQGLVNAIFNLRELLYAMHL